MKTTATQQTLAAAAVDELAQIKAQQAALNTREAQLKAELTAYGLPTVEGTLHRATVSTQTRTATDWRAVAEKLKPSRQLIAAHTSTGDPYAVIKLHARKEA